MPTPTNQLCALLRDGHVLTDAARHLPAYRTDQRHVALSDRARAGGDPAAVPVAPQLMVREDPLTLLSVFSSRHGVPVRTDRVWTPLEEVAEDEPILVALREVAAVAGGSAAPPPRRADWYRLSWYDEVEAWVDESLAAQARRRSGPVEAVKVWSLSAVLRIPCDPGPPVWLKAACPHFHAEPALTRLVAELMPEHAPPVIAVDEDRAWLLIEDLAGADEEYADEPPAGMGLAAARILATLHLRSLDHIAEIEDFGVPVRGLSETMRGFDEILRSGVELGRLTDDELAAARGTRDEVAGLLAELAAHDIPDTLVHGDLHTGNVAHHEEGVVLYDWSDAAVSHPFLDLVLLTGSLQEEERVRAREVYADAWRGSHPRLDAARVLALAEHATEIFQMVSYEQIYRSQEEASLWEMRGVVARILRRLPELMADLR